MIDPIDPEPQLKLAEVYGMLDDIESCLSILEKLRLNEEAPQYLEQWLGFYLLLVPDREEDAIRHSQEFLKKFARNESSLFNVARGYAQMLNRPLDDEPNGISVRADYREKALVYLRTGIEIDPELKSSAKEKAQPRGSFESLANDSEFLEIIAPAQRDSKKKAKRPRIRKSLADEKSAPAKSEH
jgi:tetratricopeptide (TPR) repeat protein